MNTKACLISFILFVLLFYIILISTADAVDKIMPLGDSITWDDRDDDNRDNGEKVAYRHRLWQLLIDAGYEFDFVGSENTGYDIFPDAENEGHPGWRADQIVNGNEYFPGKGKLDQWLIAEKPDIVLLHIGTNDIINNNANWTEVEAILQIIDDYESASGKAVWVVLSLIIDWMCDPTLPPCPKTSETSETSNFNNDVKDYVFFPRQAGGDNIVLVNMQNDAGIDYRKWIFGGDMYDDYHPFWTGYHKMANLWFTALIDILQPPDNLQSPSPPAGLRIKQ